MVMDGDEAATQLPELMKLQGTVRHTKNGVAMLTFLVAKHCNLLCDTCTNQGHTTGYVLCADNAAGMNDVTVGPLTKQVV